MSQKIEIPVEVRETQGKGASRRLRLKGMVPGIIYGGDRDPRMIQIPQTFLRKALENDAFYTSILEVKSGERTQKVVLRDLQRHPAKGDVTHIDLLRISDKHAIRMLVPLHFINEAKSPAGKKSGVVISHQINEIEISCLPKDLPENIEVDLADMDVGDVVQLKDIKLPEGVTLTATLSHDEVELNRAAVTAQHIQIQTVTEEAPEEPGEVPTTAAADEGEEPEADDADEAESDDES